MSSDSSSHQASGSSSSGSNSSSNKLLERIKSQGYVIVGEGYVFELERRGYLQAGCFVPECVLTEPDAVSQLHKDFCRSGSDVVEALTYYAHREKLKIIDAEDALESLNKKALSLAKTVASEYGALVAGNICNTNIWVSGAEKNNPELVAQVRGMFDEQVKWAKDAGVDFVICETMEFVGEAMEGLESIKRHGLPAVVTLAIHKNGDMRDGYSMEETLVKLAKAGACVVGLNCSRGPDTMLPLIERGIKALKEAGLGDVPFAALPVPYRTNEAEPTFFQLTDKHLPASTHNGRPFPVALDGVTCSRYEISEFTKKAKDLGVKYFGLCCGAGPHHLRALSEELGKKTVASKYSPDMSKHFSFGTDARLKKHNQEYKHEL